MTGGVERRGLIPCGPFHLEAAWACPHAPGRQWPGVVLCHPHPLYGGAMDNIVVLALRDAFLAAGFVTLRFNFRGVGRSGGEHDGGEAEGDDVRAALDGLAATDAVVPDALAVAGYSFGAWVGSGAGAGDRRVRALAHVSPPLALYDFRLPAVEGVSIFAAVGARDEYCPLPAFEAWFHDLPGGKERFVAQGVGHFWEDGLTDMARAAACFCGQQVQPRGGAPGHGSAGTAVGG